MANTFALLRARRAVIVLALVVVSIVAGKFGLPTGMWDGPL